MCRKPRNPEKLFVWLNRKLALLVKQLKTGFTECYVYGPWRKRGGRRLKKHITAASQLKACKAAIEQVEQELLALLGRKEAA